MASFGENLRREREARGVTLEDISKTTKISVRLLQAIENEDFERLPGGVFNTNFVRQYARQVGLDEDQVVSEFRALTADPAEVAVLQRLPAGTPEWTITPPAEYGWDEERRSRVKTWATIALVLVGGLAAGYLWVRSGGPSQPVTKPAPAPPVTSQTAPPSPPPQTEPAPAPTAPAPVAPQLETKPQPPPPAVPPEDPNAPVRVEIVAIDTVWVSAIADGKVVLTGTLQAEQRRVATAQERVRLRVGKAGALKVILNGQEQPPIGPAGQPRTVIFTPEGMRVVPPPE